MHECYMCALCVYVCNVRLYLTYVSSVCAHVGCVRLCVNVCDVCMFCMCVCHVSMLRT